MQDHKLWELAAGELSGEKALAQAKAIYATDHWFDYTHFTRTAQYVAAEARRVGLEQVRVDPIPAENRTRYSGWTTLQAWDVEAGKLSVTAPQPRELADWEKVPQGVIMRSEPASGDYPIVPWKPGDGQDMAGKLAFTHDRPMEVQHALRAAGGRGIVSDFVSVLPGVRQREETADHVMWEQACFRPNPGGMWGFMISPRDGRWLDEQFRAGPVTAGVDLRTRVYDGTTDAIDALLPGDGSTPDELLLIAHLYEPGANDNASGSGLLLEIARALAALKRQGKITLRRSIRFLWAYEGRGTIAWMHRHQDTLQRLVAGLNLDELGVDQAFGRSTAHVFLPPHSNPSFVGDLLVDLASRLLPETIRWKPVADRADIILDTRFSDPAIGAATPCIIQYPAHAYHTSLDRPETLSADVLRQFGLLSAVYLLRLAGFGPGDAGECDELLTRNTREQQQRLSAESQGQELSDRLGLLRERLEAKRRELRRWGIVELPALSEVIDALPQLPPAEATPLASIIPKRCSLATPGGLQLADLLPEHLRTPYRRNLLDHGLDLVFHHFFYWADGKRNAEAICRRIEEELRDPGHADAIPRTLTQQMTHARRGGLDRAAVHLLFQHLQEAGTMTLTTES